MVLDIMALYSGRGRGMLCQGDHRVYNNYFNITMTREEYKNYTYNSHWQQLRDELYKISNWCAACGTTLDVDIHHMTYERIGSENINDLVLLCRPHHFATHAFYNSLVKDFKAGALPFKPTLKEVTEFLLASPFSFEIILRRWFAQQQKINGGWIKQNNNAH